MAACKRHFDDKSRENRRATSAARGFGLELDDRFLTHVRDVNLLWQEKGHAVGRLPFVR